MFLSMACGLAMTVPAVAASVSVHTSASVHVSSKNGETKVEARTTDNESSVHISTNGNESISLSSPEESTTFRARSDSNEERDQPKISKKSRTSVSISSSSSNIEKKLSNLLERREIRLVRRICWRLGDDKEQCLEDALNGAGSTVRAKLRAWIGRL